MPFSAAAQKLKKCRQRFGITAPRVTVRTHLDWRWRLAGAALALLAMAYAGWGLARWGGDSELALQNRELRERLAWAEDEVERLRAMAGTGENVAQIEKSTHRQLLSRIRTLETENAGLKEELSVLQRLAQECKKPPTELKHR